MSRDTKTGLTIIAVLTASLGLLIAAIITRDVRLLLAESALIHFLIAWGILTALTKGAENG